MLCICITQSLPYLCRQTLVNLLIVRLVVRLLVGLVVVRLLCGLFGRLVVLVWLVVVRLLCGLFGRLVVLRRFVVVLALVFTIIILALFITLLVNPLASIVTIPRTFFLGVTVEASSEGEGFVFWVDFMMNLPERLVGESEKKDQSNVSMTFQYEHTAKKHTYVHCAPLRAEKRQA